MPVFAKRTYRRFGLDGLCVGFDDRDRTDLDTCLDGGILTVAYASEFNIVEKRLMARRLLAALNLTTGLTVQKMNSSPPLATSTPEFGGFCGRRFRRMPGAANLVIGFDGRCPTHGLFGKNGGFAMVSYADEIDQSEKAAMAERIVAVMNFTRHISLKSLEEKTPLSSMRVFE